MVHIIDRQKSSTSNENTNVVQGLKGANLRVSMQNRSPNIGPCQLQPKIA